MIKLLGSRIIVIGRFEKVGSKIGYNNTMEATFLLKNLLDDNGNFLCDHMWFNQTNNFKKLGRLEQGDLIQFMARCEKYQKDMRYDRDGILRSHGEDYGFSYPTQFKKIKPSDKEFLNNE